MKRFYCCVIMYGGDGYSCDFTIEPIVVFRMYGDLAVDLLREIKRSPPHLLPPFNVCPSLWCMSMVMIYLHVNDASVLGYVHGYGV
jgi:hypothetical protein